MSEYITHESFVASVRKRVVETARSMLNGDLNFLEGARILVDLRHKAAVRDDDSDFMAFVAIDSEIDDLPIGSVRQYWPQDVLEKLEPEYRKAEAWAKEFGSLACESLIRRFHV
jgi:hypothetical protein